MGNMKDANFMMDEIKRQAETKNPELSESDLIQFVSYLLETLVTYLDLLLLLVFFARCCYLTNFETQYRLQRDALPLFNMLRVKYKSSIDRDQLLNEVYNYLLLVPSFFNKCNPFVLSL